MNPKLISQLGYLLALTLTAIFGWEELHKKPEVAVVSLIFFVAVGYLLFFYESKNPDSRQ